MLFGSIGTVFGVMVYFVMPLAILSFDISLLLMIFFLILVGMLLGITLISLNLQSVIELAIVNSLLLFERKSMKLLIVKNLSAHRQSNRLTSIIYSLTLGCIIFVIVTADLEISLASPTAGWGTINLQID